MRVREIISSRELLHNIVLRDLRSRYKRSVVGILWSLINPLTSMAIYAVIFGYILPQKPDPGDPSGLQVFALWLLCGLLPWNFFANATSAGMRAIVDNEGLVKKVYFAREVLVLGFVGSLCVTLLLELGLLLVALAIAGNMVLPWIPVLLVVAALLAVFGAGCALFLSACYVYFRDLAYLWTIVLQAGFYAVPIVYQPGLLPDRAQKLIWLNPMTTYVTALRNAVYDLRMPSLAVFGGMVAWSAVALLLGWTVFARLSGRFAEEL